jgi:hypothetical protein
MDANSKAWREEMAAERRATQARTEATRAETRAIQAKTEAMRRRIGTSHKEMFAETKPERDMETMACRETTEAHLEEEETMACQEMEARPEEKEPTSSDMKPEAAERREVPVEDAEVMPVGEPKKKRRRTETKRNMKNSTRENFGSQKRLALARRRTSHREKVARQTRETGRMMSSRPRIAWRKKIVGRRKRIGAIIE